ncbi:prophage antirepressor [Thiovulum sp. ES]|nr:prophage antirepressor [Thiovulum sp. ES]
MHLITQDFNDFQVRILLINGKEYFIAKDIAEILQYKNTRDAVSKHCKNSTTVENFKGSDLRQLNLSDVFGNNYKKVKLIQEPDVWRLIIKSEMPEAEKIEKWIFEEVLPQIRKTGSYSIKKKAETEKHVPQTSLEIVENGIQILTKFRDLNPVEQIELDTFHKNKNGESLLEQFGKSFKNSYFLPTELGKFLGMSGAEVNLILEKKGFQFRDENDVWQPTENGKEFCLEIGNKFNQLKWKISTIL